MAPQNCWEFFDCPHEVRDKCPAYASDSGRNCFNSAAGFCPKLKSEFEHCWECSWYKKVITELDNIEWHTLFKAIGHPSCILNSHQTVLAVNKAALRVLGKAEDEVLGKKCYELFHGFDKPSEGCPHEKMLASGKFETVEIEMETVKGTFLVSCTPLFNDNGQLDKVIHIATDITKRKKAEKSLLEQSNILEMFFKHTLDCIVLLDREFNFIRVNETYARVCKRDISEFQGHNHFEFYPSDAKEIFEDVVKTKKIFRTVTRPFVFPDHPEWGITYWDWALVPILDDRGEVDLLVFTLKDVTERKQAEIKLNKAFEEINSLKEQLEAENVYLREEVILQHEHGEILGQSDAVKGVLNLVEQVAGTDSTVLIMGETGTGKELLAQSIHYLSKRSNRPMVKVNCAAIPSNLIESELFGREKGAYTGAITTQVGRFEVANGSTLFLDEIGELSSELQAKLLRVLQDGSLERLGSTRTIKVNVRIIAATNRDLERAVKDGTFRSDLFYRLNVFPVFMPPLRERREDILILLWSFVRKFERKMGKQINNIPKKYIQALQNYQWPGNVRELKNLIERSMILAKDSTLHIEMPLMEDQVRSRSRTLDEIEKNHIISVLEQTQWRVRGENGAAKILGLKPTTLDARMKKLGIKRKT